MVVLSTLGMSGDAHSKWYYRLAENLWLSAGKNSTSSPMLFWKYCKNMQIYFGYFEHTWLHSSKIIVPNCRRLQWLFACKIQTSSFTTSLRYCILKNPEIWLAGSIFAHNSRFCQTCWWNINNNISFHFRLFPRKTNMEKFFQKSKNSYFGENLGSVCPKLVKNDFFWKKWVCQFLNIPIIYHFTKNENKK